MINVRNLSFRYPDGVEALRNIDFALHRSETVAIFGANGSGKTTFLNHLVGLLHGTGTVEVCGMPVNKANLSKVRQRVGILFQISDDQIFMPTIEEDVAFGPLNMDLDPDTVRERVDRCLNEVGLNGQRELTAPPPEAPASAAGQRSPACWPWNRKSSCWTKPATYLDPPGKKALVSTLQGLPQAKVLVTHEIAFARALANRAVFFENGQVAAEGSVTEIASRFDWG